MSDDRKPHGAASDPTPEQAFAASEADMPASAARADRDQPVFDRKARRREAAGKAGSETAEVVKTIVFALLIAMVLRIFLFQPFTIPSASMEPNLYEGDYIVVSKWSYGYSRHSIPFSPPIFDGRILGKAPQRGDIVVFKLPRDDKTDFIKRVIGLPGDRIQVREGLLYINDKPVQRERLSDFIGEDPCGQPDSTARVKRWKETLPNGVSYETLDCVDNGYVDNTNVYTVPPGNYFFMGDNRDNSIDSRVEQSSGVGLVPEENLVGKAQVILFSWKPGASLWNPGTWFNVRLDRFFNRLH